MAQSLIDALIARVPRPLSPMPVRALGRDAERDARRLFEQLANPAAEHLVGVGHPLALMQNLEPGFDRERLDEVRESATGPMRGESMRTSPTADDIQARRPRSGTRPDRWRRRDIRSRRQPA